MGGGWGGRVAVSCENYKQNLLMVPKAVKCLNPFAAYCGQKATSQNVEIINNYSPKAK